MPVKHTSTPREQQKKLQKFMLDKAPRIVGVEAKRHIASNFKQEGFVDVPFKKWKGRKKNEGSRRALLVKTGRLKRSFDYAATRGKVKVFSADVPYAQIHNEGGKIQGTQRVRGHYRTNKRTGDKFRVGEFSREMNVTIPKRQFIGNSKVLNFRINKRLLRGISTIMK